ncbi:MAG: DUF305 domain-containing protein [Acetobacteraceae bacterium]|nr:DUF305 domain-containing protein [Acetobacteraceae bacterium]
MRFLSPLALAICLIGTAVLQNDVRAAAPADAGDEFTAAMSAAMERMDRGMMVPPSGDPDRDFAAMMIPHHQGAVDMAEIELRLGKNQVLRRLAEAIIVEQRQEIQIMQQVLDTLPAPSAGTPAPDPTDH